MASGQPSFISISEIHADDTFRVRVKEDQPTIEEYAELFRDYEEEHLTDENAKYPFPPVLYRETEGRKLLVSGFHRYSAAKKAGCKEIWAEEFVGDEKDAIKMAVQSNGQHGLKYQHGDFKVAIRKILMHDLTQAEKNLFHQKLWRWLRKRYSPSDSSTPSS